MKLNKTLKNDIKRLTEELCKNHSFGKHSLNFNIVNENTIVSYINNLNLYYVDCYLTMETEFDFINDYYTFYIDITNNKNNDKFTTKQQFDNIIDALKFLSSIDNYEWSFSWNYFKDLQ